VKRLDDWGLRIFVNVGATPAWLLDAVKSAIFDRPWFVVEDFGLYPAKWPRGARLAACGVEVSVDPASLTARPDDPGMILMVAEGTPDATRPDRDVAEVAPCAALTLEEFLTKVLR
jgi:hypothetical protein